MATTFYHEVAMAHPSMEYLSWWPTPTSMA
jgi:hypothetical protein